MSAASKFQVGQPVVVQSHGRGRTRRDETVAKVGRTLDYVTYYGGEHRLQAFHIDSGAERRGANAAGAGDQVLTLGEVAERARRAAVIDRLEAHGIRDRNGFRQFTQTTDVLEQVLAVLDAAKETP